MKPRFSLIYLVIAVFLILSVYRIIDLCVLNQEKYIKEYSNISKRLFTGSSAPRGRILDVNGKVLVDNVGVRTIFYSRVQGTKQEDEIWLSRQLSNYLDIDIEKISSRQLKSFYLVTHDNGKDLITSEEYKLYKKRKLKSNELLNMKFERITDDEINNMSREDKKASYIYDKMTNGYSFDSKIIKRDVTDIELAEVCSQNWPGISCGMTWKRIYPYGDVLRSIFGNVSIDSVPKELKDYYEKRGLSLNSSVGTSYLELQYDEYLRGKDEVLSVSQMGDVEVVSEYQNGADLYLSIDIDLELKLIEIMKYEMSLAKKAANSQFYDRSFIIIGHPATGEIVALCGLKINNDGFIDITSDVINTSYTVGSIVKAASMSVGYSENLIDKGKKIKDGCIKVYMTPQKCSWKSLGLIDDISAMAYSSNYYQFMIATKLANPQYKWNSRLNASQEHFGIYRKVFASYGLGIKTGIDLPNEKTGIIGQKVSDDLLLNLAIGQYDTYTPMEIYQYINTVANDGVRIKPSLMNKIVSNNKIVKENTVTKLNDAILNIDDIKSIQSGLEAVMKYGTGKNYNGTKVHAAGKTGTSETFVDSNSDGKMDTLTTSTAFISYAPADTKDYSIAIISPNIARRKEGAKTYKYALNLKLNRKIMELLFEKQ